ncbi:hypothetical protein FLAPXU55_03604 [Flavobacterium panici]|uniref:Uncharacterized protein n=1 Tax=Flavobacterium panici TaxID=2654843 RepID=A0A9N8J5I9_9FLAO|nr:hypothetical protein FLAPXU55_03604 [Flavobacterium panici]
MHIVETHSSASYAQSIANVNTGRRRTAVRLYRKLEMNISSTKNNHKAYRRDAQQCVLCAKYNKREYWT